MYVNIFCVVLLVILYEIILALSLFAVEISSIIIKSYTFSSFTLAYRCFFFISINLSLSYWYILELMIILYYAKKLCEDYFSKCSKGFYFLLSDLGFFLLVNKSLSTIFSDYISGVKTSEFFIFLLSFLIMNVGSSML